ncbi:MAG: thymidylate synthase [Alphaproteobacteria bacterium]
MAGKKHPYVERNTLDDLMREVYERILKDGIDIHPSKGPAREISAMTLRLKNPRARLSRSYDRGLIFSVLGELMWYLAGRNDLDFIRYYIANYQNFDEGDGTIWGAYGPRLFSDAWSNQIPRIISQLTENPESRKAVVQLYDAHDLDKKHKDVPCTCSLQFLVRKGAVHLITYMRSNDAYWGLPHDVFAFTMLQEMVAVSLEKKLGTYTHMVGSLHLYEDKFDQAQKYVDEGLQLEAPMPAMPFEDPWASVDTVLTLEQKIREDYNIDLVQTELNPYWQDLLRILVGFAVAVKHHGLSESEKLSILRGLKAEMYSSVYQQYIQKRLPTTTPSKATPERNLFGIDQDDTE